MSSEAERYLRDNKDKFDRDALVAQLRVAGHSEESIANAAREVYGGVAGSPHYAGFWIRFVVFIIDFSIFLFVGIPVTILVSGLAYMVFPVIYPITMIYFFQTTLGGMVAGIKVSSEDFTRLSLGKIILREVILKPFSYIILGIGFIMAGFTQKKQALHDLLVVKSVVYYEDFDNSKMKKRRTIAAVIAVLLILAFFTFALGARYAGWCIPIGPGC